MSKARALPGVVCVLTAEDLPDAKLTTDMPGQTGQKRRAGSDAPVLASDVVRFVGEPIALVAAETLAIAEHALELIEIEYEPLPGVFDPLEALKPGAPVVYEPDNVVARWKIRKGDRGGGHGRGRRDRGEHLPRAVRRARLPRARGRRGLGG